MKNLYPLSLSNNIYKFNLIILELPNDRIKHRLNIVYDIQPINQGFVTMLFNQLFKIE